MPDERMREDLQATIEARREVGAALEPQLIEGFLERIEKQIAERGGGTDEDARGVRFVTALVSLGCGIPITAIALSNGGLPALVIAWLGIVLVNVLVARRG